MNEITSAILDKLEKRDDVLAMFVSGSFARGDSDEFSDFDINILTAGDSVLMNEMPDIFAAVTPVLFHFKPFFLSNLEVFFVGKGLKVDVEYYTRLDEVTRFSGKKIRIIKDTGQRELAALSSNTAPAQTKPYDATAYLALALADLVAVAREVKRQNILVARSNLDQAREMICAYVVNNGKTGDFWYNCRRFIGTGSPDDEKAVLESLSNNDSYKGIRQAALKLLDVIATLGVFSEEALTTTRSRLEEVS